MIRDMVPPSGSAGFLDTDRIAASLGLLAGMHVADLGCGSGFFTISLARAVGASGIVTAVDIRQEPLDEVRAKTGSLGYANVREVRADLEVPGGTALGDNTQDMAVLENVLFQSQKKDAMVQEAVRMVKAGGRLVIIDWKKGAGGLGPPDTLRTPEDEMRRLAEARGVKFERVLDAGQFSYGLLFIK